MWGGGAVEFGEGGCEGRREMQGGEPERFEGERGGLGGVIREV